MSSDEGGLRRWARRKAKAKQERGGAAPVIEEETSKPLAPSQADDSADGLDATPETSPAELDLPDIESLTADSDFSVFMKQGVPPALRRLALNKLWASDPVFNVIDEMVEYGEDYTDAAMVVEGMKSAWVAGRGYATDEPPIEKEPVPENVETAAADDGDGTAAKDEDAAESPGDEDDSGDNEEDVEEDKGTGLG